MINYSLTQYERLTPVGDCVLIEKMTEKDCRMNGGILIPDTASLQNYKLGIGKILALSDKAKEKTNLEVGDHVLYDYYSAFDDNSSNILTRFENVFLKLTHEEADGFLKGTFRG